MDKILHSKSDKTVVQQVRELPDLTTNISEAKENEIMKKRRPLKITIAILSAKDTLSVKNDWFKTGKFFNHPVDTISPGQKLTFFVSFSSISRLYNIFSVLILMGFI